MLARLGLRPLRFPAGMIRSGRMDSTDSVRGEVVGQGSEFGGVAAEAFHLVDGEDDAAVRGVRLDLPGQGERGLEPGTDPHPGADLLGEDLVAGDAVRLQRVEL